MELRWYQREAVNAVWSYLSSEAGNPLIVLPTGAGKSLCIAELARQCIEWGGKCLILAHRKELLEQNADKVEKLLPGIEVGIFSAGLNRKDVDQDVIAAGIQSCYAKAHEFGERQLVIIDEAHLVPHSDDGMYRTFLNDIKQYNAWLRIIGLTATPFRLDHGLLTEGDTFEQIVYEAPIRKLTEEGFLSKLTTKASDNSIDSSKLPKRGNEFIAKDMENAFLSLDVTQVACEEIAIETTGRNSILIFTSGIRSAELTRDILVYLTHENVGLVTGETPKNDRAQILESFRNGALRWLVNCDVLTTGYDAPGVDAIAVLRSTQSPGLFAQICGRGLRTAPGKKNCLILDFGENLRRHGPLDAPSYGKADKTGGSGDSEDPKAPSKDCPKCERENHVRNVYCEYCNYCFGVSDKQSHQKTADKESQVYMTPLTHRVMEVTMKRHYGKDGKRDTLRVIYRFGGTIPPEISEWVCIEHSGWAQSKAMSWWREHSKSEFPDDIDEAIRLWKCGALRMPECLDIVKDGKYWRIQDRFFDDEIPDEWDDTDDPAVDWMIDDADIPF